MNRSPRFWLILGGVAFWPAVVLAFWLGAHGRPASEGPAAPATASVPAADARRVPTTGIDRTAVSVAPVGTVVPTKQALAQQAETPAAAAPAGPVDQGARDFAPGEIVELNYEFPNEEARRRFEMDQRSRWEARKSQEIDKVCAYLLRELKLDSGQSARLQALLLDESHRRVSVVTDLTEGRIDQGRFREEVEAIRDGARRQLDTLFTPEQMALYRTLEPRKQVLLDGAISGH